MQVVFVEPTTPDSELRVFWEAMECGKDIVDALWDRIQHAEIQHYIASLKVDYQRNPCDNKLIFLFFKLY